MTDDPAATASFTRPVLVDVARTLGTLSNGSGDPTQRRARDGVWQALATVDGPATLHVAARESTIEAAAYGPGAEAAIERVPDLLGFHDDVDDFDPSPHPVVVELARRFVGLRMGRTGHHVEALIPAVIGQKVTSHEAKASYRALALAHGERAPGPVPLVVAPRPELIAELGYAALHRFGIERRRADIVLRVCRRAADIERGRDPEALPGVGPWTAAVARQRAFGDADAVPVGDYNLPSRVAWAFAGEREADDARMLELLEPFAGHRARVLRLVELGTPKPPRRGPRRELLPFAGF